MEQAPGETHDTAEWLAAADEHERWLAALARWQRWIFLGGYCLLVIPFALSDPKILWFVFIGVVGWPLLGFLWRRLRRLPPERKLPAHQLKQLEQLRHSALAERLARGELTGDEVAEYVPRALRGLVPPLTGRPRAQVLRRVHMWQEWYLGPPRRQLSTYWTMLAAFSAMPLLLLMLSSPHSDYRQMVLPLAIFLLFAGMTAWKYEEDGSVLLAYLRSTWQAASDLAALPKASLAPASATAPGAFDQQTLLMINQVEQDLDRDKANWAYLQVFLFLLCYLPFTLARVEFIGWAGFPLLLMLPSLLLGNTWLYRKYRAKIHAQLEGSALASRLLAGELTADLLAAHVPRGLQLFLDFPASPKAVWSELRQQLYRAAFNLDWYLAPPRRLIRAHWLALSAQLAVVIWLIYYESALANYSSSGVVEGPLDPAEIALLAVGAALALPAMIYTIRVTIWSGELIAYLRRCATGESSPQAYPASADAGAGSAGGSAG